MMIETRGPCLCTHKLVFITRDMGDIHIVSGRTDIFLHGSELTLFLIQRNTHQFFSRKDLSGDQCLMSSLIMAAHINSDKVNLGMPMLSGLGSRHVNDLARTACIE